MVELKLGMKLVKVPCTLRLYDVTGAMFEEMVDEDTNAELIDGVMVVFSPATLSQDDLTGFIRVLMRGYAAEKQLGNVLGPDSIIRLTESRLFAPDIYFIRQGRMPQPVPIRFEGPPDLVVEVLSPSNRAADLQDKRPAYRGARVPEIWYVDSQRQQVMIDRRQGRKYDEETIESGRLSAHALPGFWLEVDWLWEEPLPNEMACLRKILQEA